MDAEDRDIRARDTREHQAQHGRDKRETRAPRGRSPRDHRFNPITQGHESSAVSEGPCPTAMSGGNSSVARHPAAV